MARSKLSPATKRALTTLRNQGFVVEVVTARKSANVTPSAAAPLEGKFICTTAGCYKEGHKFSPAGAFGDGLTPRVVKGHFDLNPTHTFRTI